MNRPRSAKPVFGDEEGGAFIELAIVIPILALLVFGALSLTGTLSESQVASALSRELANVAYRECLADPEAVGSIKFDPATCLQGIVNTFSLNGVPGGQIVISLYNWRPGAGGAAGKVELTARRSSAGTVSKFSTSSFGGPDPAGTALAAALQGYQRLVIAEVYVPATMEQILPRLYRYNQQDTVYASTVM